MSAEDETAEPRELKMWLAVRTDLPISRGKLAIQAMHAAGWLHLIVARDDPDLMEAYLSDATPKICVKVTSLGPQGPRFFPHEKSFLLPAAYATRSTGQPRRSSG